VKRLLVIEDGDEYAAFVRAFLAETCACEEARSGRDALAKAADAEVFLVDLRFERAPREALLGDVDEIAVRLFGGEHARAVRHLQDQQGTYILRALREAGHRQRAIFVHDFSPRRVENLRALYGDVCVTPSFDVAALRALLEAP
jgi:hypothetical protein